MEFTMSREATETNPDKEKRSPWPRYDAAVLGFHNYWYPALASRRMRHKLLSQKVFGERIVFIRYLRQVLCTGGSLCSPWCAAVGGKM